MPEAGRRQILTKLEKSKVAESETLYEEVVILSN